MRVLGCWGQAGMQGIFPGGWDSQVRGAVAEERGKKHIADSSPLIPKKRAAGRG